jgi:hypothetical protein
LFSVNITFIMYMMWNIKKIKNYCFQSWIRLLWGACDKFDAK